MLKVRERKGVKRNVDMRGREKWEKKERAVVFVFSKKEKNLFMCLQVCNFSSTLKG